MLQLNLDAVTELSQEDRSLIERPARSNLREAAARQDIIRDGERPRGVILIMEGWACCYKQLRDGRRQITSFLIPGDFGDTNALVLGRMDHSVGAITRLLYSEIAPADFEELTSRNPRLARAFWANELVASSISREWVVNVGQRSAYERLAHLICELAYKLCTAGLFIDGGCDWPLTQTDLAEATGLTSVHVNRTLQELRRDDLIELSARRLRIPDLDRLRKVGGFNPDYLHLDRRGAERDARNR